MDFIEQLPTSRGYNTILVVVDRLTKFSHFIPLTHPFSAKDIAQLFLDNIYKLHGLPESIVSDRDKIFTSKFWQEIFKMVGTGLHYSSAYHPQSDGQSERVNQCLENYLRCMCSEHPSQWSHWLSLAELWYNANFHTSLQATPFEILYGYKPTHLPLGPFQDIVTPAAANMVTDRLQALATIKENLAKAQNKMKTFADAHRSERVFEVGDWVFLKLQPYKQQTVSIRRNLKLASKYFGPFQILEKIGAVAYKLKLPPEARIHPIFHVSLLKKKVGNIDKISESLPTMGNTGQCLLEPEKVLKRRVILRDSLPVVQYLIKWNHLGEEEASWEDKSFISKQFPTFTA